MAPQQHGAVAALGRIVGLFAVLLLATAAVGWLADRASIAMGGRAVASCALSRGIGGDWLPAVGFALFALGLLMVAVTAGRTRAGLWIVAVGVLVAVAPDMVGWTSDVRPDCGASAPPLMRAPAPKPNGPVIIPDVS